MNKAKVLFLTNRAPYPVVDGQSRRTYNILKGLALYFDIHLLALYEPHEKENLNHANLQGLCSKVEFYPCPPKRFSLPMVSRLARSIFSRDPYTVWRHYSKEYSKRIQEILLKNNFDLVHCDCLPLAPVVKNVQKIPTVLTDHDVSYLKSLRMAQQSNNLLHKSFLYYEAAKVWLLEKTIFNKFALGITVSEYDKEILQGLCKNARFEIVENGVDTLEFRPGQKNTKDCNLLWLGGFNHYPNVEALEYFLNDIYHFIKAKISDVKLYVVGAKPPVTLTQFATKDNSINFLGFVDNPIPHLSAANVLICPILSGSGTRLKILEAMATEKAIVTTSIGIEGIEGVNNKHYIISDKPKEFAENVVNILQDTTLEQELGRNARRLVTSKYDWKIIWEKNMTIYSNLIKDYH